MNRLQAYSMNNHPRVQLWCTRVLAVPTRKYEIAGAGRVKDRSSTAHGCKRKRHAMCARNAEKKIVPGDQLMVRSIALVGAVTLTITIRRSTRPVISILDAPALCSTQSTEQVYNNKKLTCHRLDWPSTGTRSTVRCCGPRRCG